MNPEPSPETGADAPADGDAGSGNEPASLSLLDLLYAVPVADLATRLSDAGIRRTPRPAWGGIAVSLAVIVFSWLGYHRNRSDQNARAEVGAFGFVEPRFAQFLIEVVIIAGYFVLGLRIDTVAKNGSFSGPSAVWEAGWLVAIYCLYLAWDCLDVASGSDDWKPIAKGCRNKTAAFLVVFALAWGFAARFLATSQHAVFGFDIGLVVLLYLYRAWQDRSAPEWLRATPVWAKIVVAAGLVVLVAALAGASISVK